MGFTIASKNRNTNTNQTAGKRSSDDDEFAGYWINAGVSTPVPGAVPDEESGEYSDEDTKFVRFPKGIAVSDLLDHKVYASTNPEWAREARLMNSILGQIREKCKELDQGESVSLNLEVQLYRRQEQVEQVEETVDDNDLRQKLFG